ncbi:MAG: S-adenosylmethionine:tRNA ribosyltransferase-isomerase [Prevotella sp.]|nr:S-adenosylmethionine:tRNA ribosyltransferase-isomerase [Prevotella sp.]
MEKSSVQNIRISEYNYALPDERIAKYPLVKRDASKLLVYRNRKIEETVFESLAGYIPEGSLMVFNNTRVIQARLHFWKPSGAKIEIFCLEPHLPRDYALNLQANRTCAWLCLAGNLKKWKNGELSKTICLYNKTITLTANRLETIGDSHVIEFKWDDDSVLFSDILETGGELPVPPYLHRAAEEKDKETYQTIYSKIKGSVAAPTAGLHFTDEVFTRLSAKGVQTDEVTLHVGAGTFKPVKTETIRGHVMHTEFISVRKETVRKLLEHTGKLIAVGTTSVRTLESLYYIGSALENGAENPLNVPQWQPYDDNNNRIAPTMALENVLRYMEENRLDSLLADTQIMLTPGYEFKLVDGMLTNFHQPQSTLLLLVSAFVSGDWRTIYDYALAHDFRFLSYGDSSLLWRQ